ncbi:MAG: endonuclease/exonuclease/phosphatase family protein, partial [Acidimicrobiia bacterium]
MINQHQHLRIGTWNVQYGAGVDKNRLRRELLVEKDADIWVLTETHDDLDLVDTHAVVRSLQRSTAKAGGRWTTIMSRFPVIEQIDTVDPHRTVCARLDGGALGEIVMFGTVLPWHTDQGPDPAVPKRNWEEFARIVPLQGAEWRELRTRYPSATFVVAGDLNHNLGGPHYYGYKAGRALLRDALAASSLVCYTNSDEFRFEGLAHPPIDHVCASFPDRVSIASRVEAWEKESEAGVRLSD